MMTISDKILQAREKRAHRISALTKENETLVSIGVNFPGKDKNHPLAYLIFNSFLIKDLSIDQHFMESFDSADGPYYMLLSRENPNKIKEKAVIFEENHPLGRFLDIDVYTKDGVVSRSKKRQCYLCNQLAHICVREKQHTYDDLFSFISQKTLKYYKDFLDTQLEKAISMELNLDPKFGLVTPKTQGSHEDMDYGLMIEAKDAIMPYFYQIFYETIHMDESISFDHLIQIGKDAEEAMFKATHGINAYKGLIFHIGLLVLAYGTYLSRPYPYDFQTHIKHMAQNVFKHQKNISKTFGQEAKRVYHIQGAQGEALSGYIHVWDILKRNKELDLHAVLVDLIISIEDTNLLKRAKGMERYMKIKHMFKNLNIKDQKALEDLSQFCIKEKLSFGGSADLLIVTLLVDSMIKKHEKINL